MTDLDRITGREYKLMLRAASFCGGADRRRKVVEECWQSLCRSARIVDVAANGALKPGNARKQRLVRFYDTDEQALYRRAGFIFRLRRRIGSAGPWDATLKSRNGDWVRAAAQALEAKSAGKAKFEEDVKTRPAADGFQFVPLFSRSADTTFDRAPTTVGECLASYKELGASAFPDSSVDLALVRGFEAREAVFDGAELRLSREVDAGCAIILWSRSDGDPEQTVAAEFSLRYDFKAKGRSAKVADRAWSVFAALCGNGDWADPSASTKTAFVYEEA
jgi:hypothetical protein